jgi:hypothetical protein
MWQVKKHTDLSKETNALSYSIDQEFYGDAEKTHGPQVSMAMIRPKSQNSNMGPTNNF